MGGTGWCFVFRKFAVDQWGTSNKEAGGLGPHINFGGKIWGKVRRSLINKRKTWEVLSPQGAKVEKKVPIWGSYLKFREQNLGYLSLIFLEAKFGAPTRISEANFGANLLIWKYPLEPQRRKLCLGEKVFPTKQKIFRD